MSGKITDSIHPNWKNGRRQQEAGEIREVSIPQYIKSKNTAKLRYIMIAVSHLYDGIDNVLTLVYPLSEIFSINQMIWQ